MTSWTAVHQASLSFTISQSLLKSGGQRIGVSASASVFPMKIQGWFPLGLTGLISLVSKGLSSVFSSMKALIFQQTTLFMVQLSHLCMTIWKTTALTIWTSVGKGISLLFNELSKFVIAALLPRSKCLLISWQQPPFIVISPSLFPFFSHLFSKKDQMPTLKNFEPDFACSNNSP